MKTRAQLFLCALAASCGLFSSTPKRRGAVPDIYELELAVIIRGTRKDPGPFVVGDRAHAMKDDGKFYPAFVTAVRGDAFDVTYEDGKKGHDLPAYQVRRGGVGVDCRRVTDPDLIAFCKLDCGAIKLGDLKALCSYNCGGIKDVEHRRLCKVHTQYLSANHPRYDYTKKNHCEGFTLKPSLDFCGIVTHEAHEQWMKTPSPSAGGNTCIADGQTAETMTPCCSNKTHYVGGFSVCCSSGDDCV